MRCAICADHIERAEAAGDADAATHWNDYHAWHTRKSLGKGPKRSAPRPRKRGRVLGR